MPTKSNNATMSQRIADIKPKSVYTKTFSAFPFKRTARGEAIVVGSANRAVDYVGDTAEDQQRGDH